jgi:hypothetical protein
MTDVSRAEKLLMAVGSLASQGKSIFTAEDLVVEAWRLFQADFSLKGYAEYPDSNLVLTHIMGKRAPLIARGWIEKIGAKQYRLTDKGAGDLEAANPGFAEVKSQMRVNRRLEDLLGPLLTSDAFQLWRQGRKEEITFYQFSRFAGLSAGGKWQKVVGRLEQVSPLLEEAAKMAESGEAVRIYSGKRNHVFSPEDLADVVSMFHFLQKKFEQEMTEWRRHATAQS